MAKEFSGTFNLGIRDPRPDWQAFLLDKAPPGAPNVPAILYDDTGCGIWSPPLLRSPVRIRPTALG